MKPWMNATLALAAGVLLTGCGSMVRSNVTTFHDWPQKLPENTYVFERTAQENESLEYRAYENLVRAELNRLGLQEAGPSTKPYLTVDLDYGSQVRDVREVYPVVVRPHWYGPSWRAHPFRSPYHAQFYDPFWYGPGYVQMREDNYQVHNRQLEVEIERYADDKALYQTRVVSQGGAPLAKVMPYLVHSAFKDFPGPSGVTRQVDLRVK